MWRSSSRREPATSYVGGASRDVREVGVGETVEISGVSVTAVPAVHDARRGPHSRLQAAPVGYVVRGRYAVYFAGDTDLFPAMAEIRADVALLPIWGWGRTLGPGHLDPVTAVRAVELVRPEPGRSYSLGHVQPGIGARGADVVAPPAAALRGGADPYRSRRPTPRSGSRWFARPRPQAAPGARLT